MKKQLFLLSLFIISCLSYSQEKCTFYINDGKKPVESIKSTDIDNLKLEVTYPKKCSNYDRITLELLPSWEQSNYYGPNSFIKSQITEISGKKLTYWVFNPAVKDDGGDMSYFSRKIFLSYANNRKISNVEFNVTVRGCMDIGTEQWYDESSDKWQTRTKYGNCEILASGKLNIEMVFETFFTDPEGFVKVNFLNPNITFPEFKEVKEGLPYKEVKIRMTENMNDAGKTVGASTVLNIYLIDIKAVENLESFKKAKAAFPDYLPYQFVKDDIENYFKMNTFGCNPFGEEKRNK
jgi:hypothetical protein